MINLNYKIFLIPVMLSCIFTFSCAQNSSFVSSSYSTIFYLLTESLLGEEEKIDREVIDNIPYASALINFGKQPKSLIILESKNKNIYSWVSADNKTFFTQEGRILGTYGLSNDLLKVVRPDITFKQILNNPNQKPYFAYYSFKKPNLNNLRVEITTKVIDGQKILILGKEKDVTLIEERLESKTVYWKATNRFWLDPQSNFVWKSQQNISPRLPEVTLEVTKKPAN